MTSDWNAASWPLAGATAYMMGASRAITKPPPTVEELQSEVEKWKKQTTFAQSTILHLSTCLAEAHQACADLEEEARVEKLRVEADRREIARNVDATVKKLEARIVIMEKTIAVFRDVQRGSPPESIPGPPPGPASSEPSPPGQPTIQQAICPHMWENGSCQLCGVVEERGSP